MDTNNADDITASKVLRTSVKSDIVNTLSWNITWVTKDGFTILKDSYGTAVGGRMTAIMGESGAGKTSLLSILGARFYDKKEVSGWAKLNGVDVLGMKLKNSAFISQFASFFPTSKVEEEIMFNCDMRLKHSTYTRDERKERREELLNAFELDDCRKQKIETITTTKLSGGQYKKILIADELVTNCIISFSDEPTTGVSSTTAYSVVSSLKRLSEAGAIVVCTIHQPSSAVFNLFDDVILLAKGGKVAYHGSREGIIPFFSKLNFPYQKRTNPADYLIDTVTYSSIYDFDGEQTERIDKTLEPARNSYEKNYDVKMEPVEGFDIKKISYQTTWNEQFRAYWNRRWIDVLRDFDTKITIGIYVFIMLFASFLWFRLGRSQSDVNSIVGSTIFVVLSFLFSPSARTATHLVEYRSIVKRERASKLYRSSVYVCVEFLVQSIFYFFIVLVVYNACYWIIGLRATAYAWIISWVITYISCLVSIAFGLFIGTLIGNQEVAQSVSNVYMILSFALCQFAKVSVPGWLIWYSIINWLTYTIRTILYVQLHDMPFECPPPPMVCTYPNGNVYLQQYDIPSTISVVGYCFIIAGWVLGFFIAALISAKMWK